MSGSVTPFPTYLHSEMLNSTPYLHQKVILLQKKKKKTFFLTRYFTPYRASFSSTPGLNLTGLIHSGKVIGQRLANPVYLSSLESGFLLNATIYLMCLPIFPLCITTLCLQHKF